MESTALDIFLAATTATAVMAASAAVLRAASLGDLARAPEIDIGLATPVRVVPVLDLDAPALKLGGRRAEARLPDTWVRKPPRAPEPEPAPETKREARPSPRADASESDIPPPDMPVADAGTTPPDAAPEPGSDAAPEAESDAGPADAPGVAAASGEPLVGAAPGEGAGGSGPASSVAGPGHPDGVAGGTETDPLKARAADVYRSRLIAWFSGRFRVSGSGLAQATLTKLRAGATVQIGAGRRVAGYTMSSSGNAVFDQATKAALESTRGQELPPPPENYPDLVQAQISLTFVCKEGRCD